MMCKMRGIQPGDVERGCYPSSGAKRFTLHPSRIADSQHSRSQRSIASPYSFDVRRQRAIYQPESVKGPSAQQPDTPKSRGEQLFGTKFLLEGVVVQIMYCEVTKGASGEGVEDACRMKDRAGADGVGRVETGNSIPDDRGQEVEAEEHPPHRGSHRLCESFKGREAGV